MQRRSFLSALGAFGLAPTMPLQAFMPSATLAASAPLYNHHMFGHALAMLRSRGSVSIVDFQKAMHLTTPQAQAMIVEFASLGHVRAGFSLSGVLHAAQPAWVNWGASGFQAPLKTMLKTPEKSCLKPEIRMDDFLQNDEEESEIVSIENSDNLNEINA